MTTSPSVLLQDRGFMALTTSKSSGPITWDDATWILTSSFIIFTMQSGFGLLEAGCVSRRNEVNIMMKNAVDVVFGGISYWMYGFGLSFGNRPGSNPFCGFGYFFVDSDTDDMGILFSTYVFQLSFATTATTIVSGAMAERTKLLSYIIFSFLNTIVFCIPAHWEWASDGFLRTLGVVDIAGSGAVHLVGGTSALVAAIILKPRIGRFYDGQKAGDNPLPMGNPANTLVGMFMLWWGWLAFNCGSTFGISGGKWKLAAKAALTTLNGSMGGGVVGIVLSYFFKNKKFDVGYLVNGVLGALVAITASCGVIRPWESVIVGTIGGLLSISAATMLERLKIDDPVGAVPVHGVCGMWGMIAVGLFAANETIEDTTQGRDGLFHGGGMYLLGVQLLACVVIMVWSGVITAVLLLVIKITIGLRLSEEDEKLGADLVEHNVGANAEFNCRPRSVLFSRASNHSDQVIHSRCSSASGMSITNNCTNSAQLVQSSRRRSRHIRLDRVVPVNIIPDQTQNNLSNIEYLNINDHSTRNITNGRISYTGLCDI